MRLATCIYALLCFLLSDVVAIANESCIQPPKGPGVVSSLTKLNSLLIFIDFPDARANGGAQNVLSKIPPFTAVGDFLRTSSYGLSDITIDLFDAQVFRMPRPAASYNYRENMTADTHAKYVSDALAAAGTQVSFNGIDILWIASPSTAQAIPYTTAGFFHPVTPDGNILQSVITTGIDLFTRNSTIALLRGLGYSIGLKAQCPPSNGDNADDNTFLGSFSPMCDDLAPAPDFLATQKWTLGWLQQDQNIACLSSASSSLDRTVTLAALGAATSNQQVKLAVLPLTDSLSLYAEARAHTGVDSTACLVDSTTGGVLLYTASPLGQGPDQSVVNVINAQPGRRPIGCGGSGGRRAFVDLLVFNSSFGLASSYTLPDYGVRVEVTGASADGSQFDVRFQANIGSSQSSSSFSIRTTTPTAISPGNASAAASTTTSTPTSTSPSKTSAAASSTTSPSIGGFTARAELGSVLMSILASLFAGI